jgi:pantothenate kinase-related protein Tda10
MNQGSIMPILVAITGPIASGKNTVADLLAEHCMSAGRTVVIADIDEVAAMVSGPGLLKLVSGSLRTRLTVRWWDSGCGQAPMS